MKEIQVKKIVPQGTIFNIIRVHNKMIYMKMFINGTPGNGHDPNSRQVIKQYQDKGATIRMNQKTNWFEVNLFAEDRNVIFGDEEFDPKEKSDQEIEDLLINFYSQKFKEAGFTVELK